MRGGQSVRLEIEVFGRQDLLDQSLVESGDVSWNVVGDGTLKEPDVAVHNGEADDVSVLYLAPDSAGSYRVVASVEDCLGRRVDETEESADARCNAEFSIRVIRRVSPFVSPTEVPVNPSGQIPVVIPGVDGTQYNLFTPEEGGEAESADGSCTLRVPVGAVANGELIGVALSTGPVELTDGRYQSRGESCSMSVVDSDGDAVASYLLEDSAEACLPVPAEFRSRIVDVQMASVVGGGIGTLYGSTVRIVGDSGEIAVCGTLSELPVEVAAVARTSSPQPEDLVTPVPSPVSPDTGGYGPRSTGALMLLTMLAGATVLLALLVLRFGSAGRRRE